MMESREKLPYYAGLVQQGLETWLPHEKGELRQIFAAARYSALAPGKPFTSMERPSSRARI